MRTKIIAAGCALLLMEGSAASAQASGDTRTSPIVVDQVLGCRSIADAGQRLSCFDRAVAALGEAQSKGDLVTLDRQEVRNTRRSLFGLTLPNLRIFGDEDNSEEGSEIETRIVRAVAGPDGKWIFQLAEGGRWAQTDTRKFIVDPKAGQTIKIRRAALGSYTANVNNQRGIKVKRLN